MSSAATVYESRERDLVEGAGRTAVRAKDTNALNVVLALIAACWMMVDTPAYAQTHDPLVQGFNNVPDAAKPRVWWHWMNGNVTQAGIDLDLGWMKRIGIGGVQNFNADLRTPALVDHPLVYLSPAWRDALSHAVSSAHQMGLEFAEAASPGWSETGGPWVAPEQAMKKLVWSETTVTGGGPMSAKLRRPSDVSGPFQTMPGMGADPGVRLYRDSVVLAFPASGEDEPLHPHVQASSGDLDAAALAGEDLSKMQPLAYAPQATEAWVSLSFDAPQKVQSLSYAIAASGGVGPARGSTPQGRFEASDDGEVFRTIASLPTTGAAQQTITFAPAVARFFRLVLLRRPTGRPAALPEKEMIGRLQLFASARVHRFEVKGGFAPEVDLDASPTPEVANRDAVRPSDVIDLTRLMQPDGSLSWTPPVGFWRILRMGYSLTGQKNGPAPLEATGLEVDKLNPNHVQAYADAYLDRLESSVAPGRLGKEGLGFLVNDSWEAGSQNWTEDMIGEFQRRRGYDPRPWLPTLAGRVVGSARDSDRFLWDFRETIGDLIADAHYGVLSRALHRRGVGRYGESHETGRAFVGDGMQVKKTADIPMAAIWAGAPIVTTQAGSDADMRESASVAHIYGQNIAAAESFTTANNPYGFSPETLKPLADRAMSEGINRFAIHTSVHQPLDALGPGVGLGPFGQWFTRNETWADQAGSWISYLSRSSYLLQQGRFVADIAYFYGEDTNLTARFSSQGPAIPAGYAYDYVNADVVRHALAMKQGRMTTPGGSGYRILVLDAKTGLISLPVLRAIRDLVEAGAVVVGRKPTGSPSLADDQAQFQAISDQLWTDGDGDHHVGLGRVISGPLTPQRLAGLGVAPDVVIDSGSWPDDLHFVHRALKEGDVYFISNRASTALKAKFSFRVAGKAPQLWRADSGGITPLSYRFDHGRTTAPLQLDANGAVFVVFRKGSKAAARTVPAAVDRLLAAVDGQWDVEFKSKDGPAVRKILDRLQSWTLDDRPEIRFFSGTALYKRKLSIDAAWLRPGDRVQIDLGTVRNLAEVVVNGQVEPVAWKTPFRVDITKALKVGDNDLEIRVTNLWPNRLIGDRQPGASKAAFATFNPFTATSPLLESGLLGPVTLIGERHR